MGGSGLSEMDILLEISVSKNAIKFSGHLATADMQNPEGDGRRLGDFSGLKRKTKYVYSPSGHRV